MSIHVDDPKRSFRLNGDGSIDAEMTVTVCGQVATVSVSVDAPRKVMRHSGSSRFLHQPSQFDLINQANQLLDEKLAALIAALGSG